MGWRGRRAWRGACWPLVAVGLLWAGALSAQQVVLRGRGEPDVDARLGRLLAGPYRLMAGDTTLARGDTVQGPLLVLSATVNVSGTVRGDIVAVGANLFLRPSAHVTGDILSVAGGVYGSSLATVDGSIVDRPLASYHVQRRPGRYIIRRARRPGGALVLTPPLGLTAPTYDRVNGLGLGWGVSLQPAAPLLPELRLSGSYQSARGTLGGRAELRLHLDSARLSMGAERAPATNEAWLRSSVSNSLAYLFQGLDYHDFYDATRFWVALSTGLTAGRVRLSPHVRVQRERARSLPARRPWTLFQTDDSIRDNPPIDDGVITSLIFGLSARRVGASTVVQGGGDVELAGHALDGDTSFARYQLHAELAMNTFADQTLRIRVWARGPLPGTRSLPRQRQTFIGGSGTLYTFPIAAFRGDRLFFAESMYRIPLPERWELPVLGAPDLELLHDVGMAWTHDVSPRFQQNIGARLQFFSLYFRVMTNPARSADTELAIGLSWPFGRAYSWEHRRGPASF